MKIPESISKIRDEWLKEIESLYAKLGGAPIHAESLTRGLRVGFDHGFVLAIERAEEMLKLADSVCCEEDVTHYSCAVTYRIEREEWRKGLG